MYPPYLFLLFKISLKKEINHGTPPFVSLKDPFNHSIKIVEITSIKTERESEDIIGLEVVINKIINNITANDTGSNKLVFKFLFEVFLQERFGPIPITNKSARITGPFTEL